MTPEYFRRLIQNALLLQDDGVELAIRRELSSEPDLGDSGYLQFEIDPVFYGIHLVQTEETILEGDAILDLLPSEALEIADDNNIDWLSIIAEELVCWFSAQWKSVSGPDRYSPAYVFFHGGLNARRFDLEKRVWLSVEEVWPDDCG